MDIAGIAREMELEEDGAVMPVVQKNGAPYLGADGEPATFTIVGADSKRVQAAERANTRKTINRGARSKITPEALQEGRVTIASAAVISWTGWEDSEGVAWPCTPDNVRQLLAAAPWILRQVEDGVSSHADFFVEP